MISKTILLLCFHVIFLVHAAPQHISDPSSQTVLQSNSSSSPSDTPPIPPLAIPPLVFPIPVTSDENSKPTASHPAVQSNGTSSNPRSSIKQATPNTVPPTPIPSKANVTSSPPSASQSKQAVPSSGSSKPIQTTPSPTSAERNQPKLSTPSPASVALNHTTPSPTSSQSKQVPTSPKSPELNQTIPSQPSSQSKEVTPSPSRSEIPAPSQLQSPSPSPSPSKSKLVTPSPSQSKKETPTPSPSKSKRPKTSQNVSSNYSSISIGSSSLIDIGKSKQIYKGRRGTVPKGAYSDMILVVSLKESPQAARSLSSSDSLPLYQLPNSLVIDICVPTSQHSTSHHSHKRTYIYAFRQDPIEGEASIIAASGHSDIVEEQRKCIESTRLEVPIDGMDDIYVLLTREKRFGKIRLSVRTSLHVPNLDDQQSELWNKKLLSETSKRNRISATEEATVFVLSSIPSVGHNDIQDSQVDMSGVKELVSEAYKLPTGPVCSSAGTHIASAILGNNIGYSNTRTTIIPVPVSDCKTVLSRESLTKAFDYVSVRMTQQDLGHIFVVLESSNITKGLLQKGFKAKVLKEWNSHGVVVLLPYKGCIKKSVLYLSVGAFGMSGNDMVVAGEESCLTEYDMFGPGLNVLAASATGPFAYRTLTSSPNVAAAGIAEILRFVSERSTIGINNTMIKKALSTTFRPTPTIVDGETVLLPLLGVKGSLGQIESSIASHYNGFSVSKDEGAFSKLSIGAIVGICVAIMFIILVIIAGVVLFRRRSLRSDDNEDEESSDFALSPGDQFPAEHPRNPTDSAPKALSGLHKKLSIKTDRFMSKRDRDAGNIPSTLDGNGISNMGTPDRRKGEKSERVPVVQRFFSLSKSKESPITKSAKASWFATPTAQAAASTDVFGRKDRGYKGPQSPTNGGGS